MYSGIGTVTVTTVTASVVNREGYRMGVQSAKRGDWESALPARDPRDEHPDERRPRDPPAPVKHGPRVHPVWVVRVVQPRLRLHCCVRVTLCVIGQQKGGLHFVEQRA